MKSRILAIGAIAILIALNIGGCGGGGGGGGGGGDPAKVRDPDALFAKNLLLDNFVKGNTHAHTLRSWDSDAAKAPTETVINWYRDNGYNFLAITDHDLEFQPALYSHLQTPDFILIPGEEVSSTWFDETMGATGDDIFVHVAAICTDEIPITGKRIPAARYGHHCTRRCGNSHQYSRQHRAQYSPDHRASQSGQGRRGR